MKSLFISAMESNFKLSAMLEKIRLYHIRGSLTDDEVEELEALARKKAVEENSNDINQKIIELEKRIRKLEEKEENVENANKDYVAGKWYYNGDVVVFNGKTYVCTAPKNVACVWSPEEYPVFWALL